MWFNGAEEEYYCADLCDPSPCTGDETCSLEERDDCDTAASPCPPVAACSASLVAAEEETETGTDEETQVICLTESSRGTPAVQLGVYLSMYKVP